MELEFTIKNEMTPSAYTVNEILSNWRNVLSKKTRESRIVTICSYGANREHAKRVVNALGESKKKWKKYLEDLIAFHYSDVDVDLEIR